MIPTVSTRSGPTIPFVTNCATSMRVFGVAKLKTKSGCRNWARASETVSANRTARMEQVSFDIFSSSGLTLPVDLRFERCETGAKFVQLLLLTFNGAMLFLNFVEEHGREELVHHSLDLPVLV